MGDGAVLEKGKHNELLGNRGGPYARLVAAQGLREIQGDIGDANVVLVGQEPCKKAVTNSAEIEKASIEEVPLGSRNTSRSLGGKNIEQRKAQMLSNKEKEYSMFYLFKRMGRINRAEWKYYLFGSIFSIGKYSPLLGLSWPLTIVLQLVVPSSPLSVSFGVRKCGLHFPHGQS